MEDYFVEGPRAKRFSDDSEYRCVPVYSFKNSEAQMWIHHHDVLITSNGLPSDYISDIRRGCSVCFLLSIQKSSFAPIGVFDEFGYV